MENRLESYLPVFSGFYNTIFEPTNEEDEINDINQQREANGMPEIEYDDCEWNYDEYRTEVAKEATKYLQGELRDILKTRIIFNFQNIFSPREYNFKNDSINIEIIFNKKTIKAIKDYLVSHKEQFTEYLKNTYTSYDGFTSFYANDYDTWMEKYFLEIDTHKHYMGSILNFILSNEKIDDLSIYNEIETTSVWASNYHELIGDEPETEKENGCAENS